MHFVTQNDHISGIFAHDKDSCHIIWLVCLFQLTTTVGSIMEGFDKLCSADPDTLMTVPPTSSFSFDGFMTLLCDINMTVLMEESNSYSGQKTIMDAVSIDRDQRAMCIKGLFWPPLEPKTEIAFHHFFFIGLLEE